MARPVVAIGLSVEHNGVIRDVVADLPFGATVRSLGAALSAELDRIPSPVSIQVERTGAVLAPDALAADCDLRSGDMVRLLAAPSQPPFTSTRRGVPVHPPQQVEVSLRSSRHSPRERSVSLEPEVTLKSTPARAGRADITRHSVQWADGSRSIPPGNHIVGAGASCDIRLPIEGLPEVAFELAATQRELELRPVLAAASVSLNGTVLVSDWASVSSGSQVRSGTAQLSLFVRSAEPERETPVSPTGDRASRRTLALAQGGEIPFNRPPRRTTSWRPETIELPAAPAPFRAARIPYLAALVPVIAGFALFLFLHQVAVLAFMAISPLMVGATYFGDRRSGRKDHAEQAVQFEARLAATGNALYEAVSQEVAERHAQSPQLAEVARWPLEGRDRLWERRAWDSDFMALPIGWGRLPAVTRARVAGSYGVETDVRVAQLEAQYAEVDDVPYVIKMAGVNALGLTGDRPTSVGVARALILQAVLLHSPLELGVAAALARGAERGWEWLKWLPHAKTGAALLDGPALGTGVAGHNVVRRLAEARRRWIAANDARGQSGGGARRAALLLILDEELDVDRSIVAEVLDGASALGISVLWIGMDTRSLPGGCGVIVETAPDQSARLIEVANGTERWPIRLDIAEAPVGATIARSLAPLRDSSGASAAVAIPERVRLLEQIGLEVPTRERLAEAWQQSRGGLNATIGEGAGQPFEIELRADGPHALIAGTTGAGKSELLRTIVASLAARHPPTRLTFLLIDYKGGAAFAPCAALPHVLDVVSDLDAELGERALVSLTAEMRRREQLLAELRADNIVDLERRALEQAPPNLLIMVDEFAKLREEIPEFIDGVVDIAQRGRTLGIHMLLAAQSLRSAFTPAVRANTNLRIALRVTSEAESLDVVDSPDAAHIPSGHRGRGRAFARIGHERLIEFQVSHVSGRYHDPAAAEASVRPFAFETVLEPSVRRRSDDDIAPGSDETDLAALARTARAAARTLAVPQPRAVWAPPLPRALPRSEIQAHTDALEGKCAFGIVDQPEHQRRVPLLADLDAGHVAIFGAAGSGKTTALATIAATMAADAPPWRLQIYGLDGGSGALGTIASLPHVGSVIPVSDPERLQRLLAQLEREARRRGQQFAAAGAVTLTEYQQRATTQTPPPRIVLLIDGFGEFASTYDDARPDSPFERLLAIIAAGRNAGIHVILTASRRSAVKSSVAAHLAHRLLLRSATADDLVAGGVPSRLAQRIELTPGRGFTARAQLFQIALPAAATIEDPVAAFRMLGAHLESAWPGQAAPVVGSLPEHIPYSTIRLEASSVSAVRLGVSGEALEPVAVDLTERHFLVSGPYRSGRSTALRVIALQMLEGNGTTERHLLAPRRSSLLDLGPWDSVARGVEACADAAVSLADHVAQLPETSDASIVVFVDDGGELQDARTALALEKLVRAGRDRGLRVVAAAETAAARMLTNAWLRELRKDGYGLLLCPESLSDGDILSVPLPRRQHVMMVPGRGYLVSRSRPMLVQVALADDEPVAMVGEAARVEDEGAGVIQLKRNTLR